MIQHKKQPCLIAGLFYLEPIQKKL